MYPSPSPSPAPSPPAYLYLNSHHHQTGSHGGGPLAGGSAAQGSSSQNQPTGHGLNGSAFGPNGSNGFNPVGRFPLPSAAWPPRAQHHPHHSHQQNPSLSSLPGSISHSSAASVSTGGPPSSPAYANLSGAHHHHHSVHGPHGLSHMSSPATLHPSQNHLSSNSSNSASHSPHWQQQLIKAEISRQSGSPHHHARAAALAARSATSSAIVIQDPNKSSNITVPAAAAANGLFVPKKETATSSVNGSMSNSDDSTSHGNRGSNSHRKGAPTSSGFSAGSSTQTWTTIDMGGLSLKTVTSQVFRYSFLTSLFINHNSLSTISPDIVKLKNLTVLDASGNKIVSVPPELGMLTCLRELFLFDNNLVTLPPEMGALHQLDILGIEGNPLTENLRSLFQREGTQAVIAYLRDSCPVPLPPPEREWISIEPDLPSQSDSLDETAPPPESFNVLSYNVLCERYATAQMYGYTPSWALAWDYRKEFILQEAMSYSADICCLQEVDTEQYEDYFHYHLSQQDYEGVFWPKSRARTMRDEEKRRVDGCATFFKTTKYTLIEKQLIEFNQIALQRPDFKKTEDMFNRVMTKDNIAAVALLENKESGSRLIVANAHIHWDPEYRDVKLVQVAMLMDELEKIGNRFVKLPPKLNVGEGYPPAPKYTNGNQIPTIICGDFNSVPQSGVYDFLSAGSLAGDHEDFMDHVYGNYTAEGLGHKYQLKSAYSNIGELPFTNYTPGFEGVIDYIWYNTNALSVTGLLGEVEKTYLSKVVGFPNAHFPSDHVCILAEYRVKHSNTIASAPPKVRSIDFSSMFPSNGNRDRDRNGR